MTAQEDAAAQQVAAEASVDAAVQEQPVAAEAAVVSAMRQQEAMEEQEVVTSARLRKPRKMDKTGRHVPRPSYKKDTRFQQEPLLPLSEVREVAQQELAASVFGSTVFAVEVEVALGSKDAAAVAVQAREP